MLASFEIHVSFPLVRVCGMLFHCMLPDVMPERKRIKKREKKREKTTEIKGKKNASKKKRREKETSLFWDVGVIYNFNNLCIFIK